MDKHKLFSKHKKLIYKVAHKHCNRVKGLPTYSYEDIYQIASVGFLEACESYDTNKGVPFQAYASKMMHWHINNSLRNRRIMVKYPFYFEEIWNIANKHNLHYNKEDIHKLVDISKYTYNQVVNAMKCYDVNSIAYLDKELEDGSTLHDIVSGGTFDESEAVVLEYLSLLTEKQKQVVMLLMEEKTQTEIGSELGISQQQVSRIIKSLQKVWVDNYE